MYFTEKKGEASCNWLTCDRFSPAKYVTSLGVELTLPVDWHTLPVSNRRELAVAKSL